MKTILITGGRAPASLELARCFSRAGYRVISADSLAHHLSRFSNSVARNYQIASPRYAFKDFIDALLSIVKREAVDLVLPTCEEVFYISMGLDRLSACCEVFTPPINVLNRLHHKYDFIRLAQGYGLKVPDTVLLESQSQAEHYARLGYVLKPVYSRFATRVRLPPHKTVLPLESGQWLAQRYLVGRQICTYSIVRQGRLVAHTAYPSVFRLGAGATVQFEHIRHDAALAWVQTFVAATGLSGQLAFDFIETPEGLFALECNPRATSGVHLLAGCRGFAEVFFTDPDTTVMPAPQTAAMVTAAMLNCFGTPGWYRAFRKSRDVLFSWQDPVPFCLQGLPLVHFGLEALHYKISLTAASTCDLEWNGKPQRGTIN